MTEAFKMPLLGAFFVFPFVIYGGPEISIFEIQENNVDSSVPQQVYFQGCLEFLCSVGLTS